MINEKTQTYNGESCLIVSGLAQAPHQITNFLEGELPPCKSSYPLQPATSAWGRWSATDEWVNYLPSTNRATPWCIFQIAIHSIMYKKVLLCQWTANVWFPRTFLETTPYQESHSCCLRYCWFNMTQSGHSWFTQGCIHDETGSSLSAFFIILKLKLKLTRIH